VLYEPSTLASTTALLAAALREDYGIDPEPIYLQAGISLRPPETPQLRYPISKIRKLWELARIASGDDAIGLKTGGHAKPAHFYAFGYSWLASSTLLGAMQRLTRYMQLMSTVSVVVSLTETPDSYALSATFPDPSKAPPKEGIDSGMTALRAPISFNAKVGVMQFDKETLRELLPLGAPDVAKVTDRIAEQYIDSSNATAIGPPYCRYNDRAHWSSLSTLCGT